MCWCHLYQITEYSKKKAKDLGVLISPSKRKHKKLDVYDGVTGKYIVSVGHTAFYDYPTYILKMGKKFADERRKLYYDRHKHDEGLAGYYAKKLLW